MSSNQSSADSGKKASLKRIVLPVVAVVLVAAILLTYFFWYKPAHQGQGESSGGGSDERITVDLGESGKEYNRETGTYHGFVMPVEFADYLNNAEKDSEKACDKYGIALTIGSHRISKCELTMNYYDEYCNDVYEFAGGDKNGIALASDSLPSEQTYKDGVTWSDKLTELAIERATERYLLFDEAMKYNLTLSYNDIQSALSNLDMFVTSARDKNVSVDDITAKAYGDGVTFNMYARNLIMSTYVVGLRDSLSAAFEKQHTEQEIDEVYFSDTTQYDYIDVRILTMKKEKAIDEESLSKLKTLQDFYDYGTEYYSEIADFYTFNPPLETNFLCSTRYSLATMFGEEIAKWCYDPQRKAGDIGSLEGGLFQCLVYVERPQYRGVSARVIDCTQYFDYETGTVNPTDEQRRAAQNTIKGWLDSFEAGEKTEEAFAMMAAANSQSDTSSNRGYNDQLRLPEVERTVSAWTFFLDHEPGDYGTAELTNGYTILYFCGINEDDYDYKYYVLQVLVAEDYDAYYASLLGFNGNEVVRNASIIKESVEMGEKCCQKYLDIAAEEKASAEQGQ